MRNAVHQATFCTGTYHSKQCYPFVLHGRDGLFSKASPNFRGYKSNTSRSNKLVWPVPLAQVLPRPQLIFLFKTWFFEIYLNFQWQNSLSNQYLAYSESKSYQINPADQDLSNNTKVTSQFLRIFSYDLI
jgi:hypothetical protein